MSFPTFKTSYLKTLKRISGGVSKYVPIICSSLFNTELELKINDYCCSAFGGPVWFVSSTNSSLDIVRSCGISAK
jgi:hypothetical protein